MDISHCGGGNLSVFGNQRFSRFAGRRRAFRWDEGLLGVCPVEAQ